jgi:hypothetical protein
MIAFHWLEPDCSPLPTLYFDIVLDLFFLVDIIVTFNTGQITSGEYIDARYRISKDYIRVILSNTCQYRWNM